MDLHKRIAEDVRSREERDRAREFLRTLYNQSIKGTDWESLARQLDAQHEPIDEADALELYEVEDRAVAVVWPDEGMGHAWVWSDGWRSAPGLVNKSWLEGERLSRAGFQTQFPTADVEAVEQLAQKALSEPQSRNR